MSWIELMKDFGFPVTTCIALMWFISKQYARLAKRLSTVEDYIKKEHIEMIKTNQEIIVRATRAIENCEKMK